MLLYILCGAHCAILSAGLSERELHRSKSDLQSKLLWWTQLCSVYVWLLVTALPWTLKNTMVCYAVLRSSWVLVACYGACRSADSPPAVPVVTGLEGQHRTLDPHCVRLAVFIESCVSWGILAREPRAPRWAGCTSDSLICIGCYAEKGWEQNCGKQKGFQM